MKTSVDWATVEAGVKAALSKQIESRISFKNISRRSKTIYHRPVVCPPPCGQGCSDAASHLEFYPLYKALGSGHADLIRMHCWQEDIYTRTAANNHRPKGEGPPTMTPFALFSVYRSPRHCSAPTTLCGFFKPAAVNGQ